MFFNGVEEVASPARVMRRGEVECKGHRRLDVGHHDSLGMQHCAKWSLLLLLSLSLILKALGLDMLFFKAFSLDNFFRSRSDPVGVRVGRGRHDTTRRDRWWHARWGAIVLQRQLERDLCKARSKDWTAMIPC